MFNWFKKPKYVKPWVPEVPETTKTVVTPLPPAEEQPAYQVGVTESGKVTLRLSNNFGYTTLTMNNRGVLKLIDMLEAALDDAAFEHDTPKGHDGRGPG